MMYSQFRSAICATTVVLTCVVAAGCGSGSHSSSGGTGGGTVGGAVGGAVGGNAGGAAAAGGAAGAVEVPTEVIPCHVDFSPSTPASNNQALGMTWGDGRITFNVSMDCSKPLSRGTLTYAIYFTGTSNPRVDISPARSFNLAGVKTKSFPYVVNCVPGSYVFEYQWEATADGASDSKQDANTSAGVLLTSYNCKSKV